MDHSLQGYLGRLSTENLNLLLQHFSQEKNQQYYEYEITSILQILEQRYALQENIKNNKAPDE